MLKILLIVGIVVLIGGGIIITFGISEYFQVVKLQEEYPSRSTSPGSNMPYPSFDYTFELIGVGLGMLAGGILCLAIYMVKK